MHTTTELLEKLASLAAENPKCGEMYCTTCGGYARLIFGNLTKDLSLLIDDVLASATLQDFCSLGGWRDKILVAKPEGVLDLCIREAKNLNLNSIEEIDFFIYHSSIVKTSIERPSIRLTKPALIKRATLIFLPLRKYILGHAISHAFKSKNISLIESIVLTERTTVINSPSLLELAIDMSKDNTQLARALYNQLREEISETRFYVGDGTTVRYR